MINVIARETRAKEKPMRSMSNIRDIKEHIQLTKNGNQTVAEFVGTGDFASAFTERQRYEVEAGRDMEPILYDSLYDVVVDGNLPQTLTIYTLNPNGLVLEEIEEGEEVKFTAVSSGSKAVTQLHYAAALEYTDQLLRFTGNLWQVPRLERSFGAGINALLNHIHLNPFITGSYAASRQVDGTSLSPARFRATDQTEYKYMRTIEQAIKTARGLNMYGPYAILCSTGDAFTIQRALNPVPQQSADRQGSFYSAINQVIAYDGWSGTRGKKATTYSGVSDGTAYLISLSRRSEDFLSLVNQPLRRQSNDGDLSRFIVEQVVWDTYFGVYTNVTDTVIEITLPGETSGAS